MKSARVSEVKRRENNWVQLFALMSTTTGRDSNFIEEIAVPIPMAVATHGWLILIGDFGSKNRKALKIVSRKAEF